MMKTTASLVTAMGLSIASGVSAGVLEECMIRGDHAAVTRCLVEADKEAQAALVKAEGDAGKKARDIDTATGRSSASPALARSMRAFTDYRKAQCDFVRALYGSGNGADQAQIACTIDLTRRRVRELQI